MSDNLQDAFADMSYKEYVIVRNRLQSEGLWTVDTSDEEEAADRRTVEILKELRGE